MRTGLAACSDFLLFLHVLYWAYLEPMGGHPWKYKNFVKSGCPSGHKNPQKSNRGEIDHLQSASCKLNLRFLTQKEFSILLPSLACIKDTDLRIMLGH